MVSDASFLKIFLPAEAAYPLFQNTSLSLEKEMAPHSSTLAWKIPWMEEPGRLQSTGSRRVKTRLSNFIFTFTFMHWRRKWQPTPVFLSKESQGRRSLVGCCLWACTESDWSDLAAASSLSLLKNQVKISPEVVTLFEDIGFFQDLLLPPCTAYRTQRITIYFYFTYWKNVI